MFVTQDLSFSLSFSFLLHYEGDDDSFSAAALERDTEGSKEPAVLSTGLQRTLDNLRHKYQNLCSCTAVITGIT